MVCSVTKMFQILLVASFISIISCHPAVESSNGTFYYFAYGSNLLAKRMHIKNPTAVYYSAAKLEVSLSLRNSVQKTKIHFLHRCYKKVWNLCVTLIFRSFCASGNCMSIKYSELKRFHFDFISPQ